MVGWSTHEEVHRKEENIYREIKEAKWERISQRTKQGDLNELNNIINNPSVVNFEDYDLDLDHLAAVLLPSDIDQLPDDAKPVKSSPDGNCLFNSISILLCGDQRLSSVLRDQASKFMVQSPNVIAHHPVLTDSAQELRRSEEQLFPDLLAMVTQKSIWYKTKNRETSVVKTENFKTWYLRHSCCHHCAC